MEKIHTLMSFWCLDQGGPQSLLCHQYPLPCRLWCCDRSLYTPGKIYEALPVHYHYPQTLVKPQAQSLPPAVGENTRKLILLTIKQDISSYWILTSRTIHQMWGTCDFDYTRRLKGVNFYLYSRKTLLAAVLHWSPATFSQIASPVLSFRLNKNLQLLPFTLVWELHRQSSSLLICWLMNIRTDTHTQMTKILTR